MRRMGEESVSVGKEGKEGEKSRVALFARKKIEGWNFSATDQKVGERKKEVRKREKVREGIREELVRGEVSVKREGRRRRLTCLQGEAPTVNIQHTLRRQCFFFSVPLAVSPCLLTRSKSHRNSNN